MKKNCPLILRIKVLILLTFLLCAITLGANENRTSLNVNEGRAVVTENEGRPMRVVPPEIFIPQAPLSTPLSLRTNTLLTERALSQPLTQQFIEEFSSPRRIAWLNNVMQRAALYMPFIIEEVTQRGLPPELAFVPIIESAFQITAISRSGAQGLWQFMLNSISPYDMRVSDLIDERRDFVKSTRGALQKLEDEHRRLGCWELTLAAYNGGLGTVTRAVQRAGIHDYWVISERRYIKPETINFVPRILAVSYIMSQPRRFGINDWHQRLHWIDIPLERQISIDIIADETGIDRNLMRSLNAELLYGISPTNWQYRLKIPLSHLDRVNEVLNREDLRLIRYYYHIVRSGDTLWSLSRQYGASLSMLESHNPGVQNRFLRVGETLIIPALGDSPVRPRAN